MGNCQAAEPAKVVIQHPAGGKVERVYWSISANQVMSANPGHYVALVLDSGSGSGQPDGPGKQLKLLRPDDTLHIGHVYRLISFEEVIKEFAAKKSVKLGKLLKESGVLERKKKNFDGGRSSVDNTLPPKVEQHDHRPGSGGSSSGASRGVGRHHGGGAQWKPALQSIAESGS